MALNKLKKWIGTQAMTAFFDQLNDNVDATNAAIDLAEQNATNISSMSDNVLTNTGTGNVLYTIQREWENLPAGEARLYSVRAAGTDRRLGVTVIDKTNNSNGQALVLDGSGNTLHTLTNGVWS